MMSNTDMRGVKRGACNNCDCEEYMFKSDAGPPCYYCSCPPTKHLNLDQSLKGKESETSLSLSSKEKESESGVSTVTELTNLNLSTGLVTVNNDSLVEIQPVVNITSINENGFDVIDVTEIPVVDVTSINKNGFSTTAVPQHSSKLLELESLLPEKLPKCVEIALQNKKLTSALRCKIVRSIADRCFAADAPLHVVDIVADMAVDRWSPLRSQYGHKSKALAMQVKRRMAKLRMLNKYDTSVSVKKEKEDSNSFDSDVQLMLKEMQDDISINRNGFAVANYQQNCPTLQKLESLLPEKLPKCVEVALANNKLTNPLRCIIVRAIADRCYAADVQTHMIDLVADMAVDRWSPLRSQYGHKSKALAMQLKRRMAKLRAFKKDDSLDWNEEEEEDEDISHYASVQLMLNEMQETQPSKIILKNCLTAIRPLRRISATQMSVAEHLNKYPALKIQDLLLWEFCSIIEVPASELETRWTTSLEYLKKYLKGSPHEVPENCLTYDMKTVYILSVLPQILPSGKKTKKAIKLVLQLFLENTAVEETIPDADEPPRLIGIGNPLQTGLRLTCYVDGTPLFTEQPVQALLLLLASYWVFDIPFCSEVKPSLSFISAVVLKDKFQSPYLYKSPTVSGLLRQLNL